MIEFLRRLLRRDTGKLRNEAVRENLRRECEANQEASSQVIRAAKRRRDIARLTRKVFHGPESI